MIALIINFNRLLLPAATADWCAKHGLDPVFVDNHSDYPPLLEYYYHCPYDVYRLKENRGHKVIASLNLKKTFKITGSYIATDPDLDLSGVPDDFLDVLKHGLKKYPDFRKCGFSLEINDLPDTKEGNFIRNSVEPSYWQKPLNNLYFDAPVDTTFALYRREDYGHSLVGKSIRTNRPYTVKHIPWYYTDINLLSEDEQYYYKTANSSASGKGRFGL
jgi:hypothetical protein